MRPYTFAVNNDDADPLEVDRITVNAASVEAARKKAVRYVAARYPTCRVGSSVPDAVGLRK